MRTTLMNIAVVSGLSLAGVGLIGCPAPLPDAGPDAGPEEDAGPILDAGPGDPDAGPGEDAGPTLDAGPGDPDAGAIDCPSFTFPFEWPVESSTVTLSASDAWKDSITPSDPFVAFGGFGAPSLRWVHFTIVLSDPTRVLFQDSFRYVDHAAFVSEHLDPWLGQTPSAIESVSAQEEGQELAFGTLFFPRRVGTNADLLDPNEVVVQFHREDPYHPEMTRQLLEHVTSAIGFGAASPAAPVLTALGGQQCLALEWTEWLQDEGITIGTTARWDEGDTCLIPGWTLGRLTYVDAADIETAWLAGELLPTDILLTNEISAAPPPVAGIITLGPANVHAAWGRIFEANDRPVIEARTTTLAEHALSLVGSDVLVLAAESYEGPCGADVVDLSTADAAVVDEARLRLEPPAATAPARVIAGSLSSPLEELNFNTVSTFGHDATWLAVARAALPERSRPTVAVSFDLWTAFFSQPADAVTLGEQIAADVGTPTWPPGNASAAAEIAATLAGVRARIESAPVPVATLDALVAEIAASALGTATEIRVRPSSNTGDGGRFSSEGLYRSAVACLADDLDNDATGPSLCDPNSPQERGLETAIQTVFASFYSDRAFIERLRRGVTDDDALAIGLVLDAAFEASALSAHGRSVLRSTAFSTQGDIYTQPAGFRIDDASVRAAPERVSLYINNTNVYPDLVDYSLIAGAGSAIFEWPAGYEDLGRDFNAIGEAWRGQTGQTAGFQLGFSFAVLQGEGFVVDGLHHLLDTPRNPEVETFLFDEGGDLCVFQGEAADLFANHRLKQRLSIPFRSVPIRAADLTESPFDRPASLEYVDEGVIATLTGAPTSLPGANFAFNPNNQGLPILAQDFQFPPGTATFGVSPALTVPQSRPPFLVLGDTFVTFQVAYAEPKPALDYVGNPIFVDSEIVILEPCRDGPLPPLSLLHEPLVESGGLSVQISMYYPPGPTGITAGYTAPLQKWNQTTIVGLTTEPLVLTSWWAQTFRPQHHNFSEDFLFEPRLDPGVTQAQLDELDAADVIWIVVQAGYEDAPIFLVGADGTFREAGGPP